MQPFTVLPRNYALCTQYRAEARAVRKLRQSGFKSVGGKLCRRFDAPARKHFVRVMVMMVSVFVLLVVFVVMGRTVLVVVLFFVVVGVSAMVFVLLLVLVVVMMAAVTVFVVVLLFVVVVMVTAVVLFLVRELFKLAFERGSVLHSL